VLATQVFTHFGAPVHLLTDGGREFQNELFLQLMKWMEIEKLRTTPYKPSTNGIVERFHRTLNPMSNGDQTIDDYVVKQQEMASETYQLVRENLTVNAERRKVPYDVRVRKPEFGIGDSVWYYYREDILRNLPSGNDATPDRSRRTLS